MKLKHKSIRKTLFISNEGNIIEILVKQGYTSLQAKEIVRSVNEYYERKMSFSLRNNDLDYIEI
jgi:hypothetical protein